MRATTVLLLGLPALFGWLGLALEGAIGFVGLAVLLLFLYALIWLVFRPTRFEIDDHALHLIWPVFRQSVPRHDVVRVRRVTRNDVYASFGWCLRIGAGGFGGGFGRLWTSKAGLVDLWVSRLDGWVLIERRANKPILVTPTSPDEFVRVLGPQTQS